MSFLKPSAKVTPLVHDESREPPTTPPSNTTSGMVYAMSLWPGTTALNFAVMRGDVEIVKILLENGADPYIENDLGMNAFDICEEAGPFPSVRRALNEHVDDERE